jgi:hypothetical protein
MDELAKLNSTDKTEHGYTHKYDWLFLPMKYMPIRILEIGFWRGRSARMFAEYFHRGVVHSLDIEPNHGWYENIPEETRKRVRLWQADQGSKESLKSVLKQIADSPRNHLKRGERPFEIIIDDGSHQPDHQRLSFQCLWDHVAPGGFYIIEDFHPAYHDNTHKTVEWLFNQVHVMNRFGNKLAKDKVDYDFIMFAYNQAIIRKKI